MLEAVHARVYEQGLIIEQQKQEIEYLKGSHMAQGHKIDHLMASPLNTMDAQHPPLSYKEALKSGLPEITTSILKEQMERQRRIKNIVIKDKRDPKESFIQPASDPTVSVLTWLTSNGLSKHETSNSSDSRAISTNETIEEINNYIF
jgi:hypothetical protein